MEEYELTLHPDKTKIVYCKNYQRTENNDNESFTFLSYSFQPRARRDKFGRKKTFFVFSGAISNAAKTSIREAIRGVMIPRWSQQRWTGLQRSLIQKSGDGSITTQDLTDMKHWEYLAI